MFVCSLLVVKKILIVLIVKRKKQHKRECVDDTNRKNCGRANDYAKTWWEYCVEKKKKSTCTTFKKFGERGVRTHGLSLAKRALCH
jgi:hypothetical protein